MFARSLLICAALASCGDTPAATETPYDGTGRMVDGVCRADERPAGCADTLDAELAGPIEGGCHTHCGGFDVVAYAGFSGRFCGYDPASGALAAITVYTDINVYCQERSGQQSWGEGEVSCEWEAIHPCPE